MLGIPQLMVMVMLKGRRLKLEAKDESFSVSKIWLWPKKGKFPSSSNTHIGPSINVGFP